MSYAHATLAAMTPATAKWPKPQSPGEFQEICADFARLRWCDPHAALHGRNGQAQHGVDIVGHPPYLGGKTAGAQCKNTEALNMSAVKAEVEKAKTFRGGLGEFLVITSGDHDAKLQRDVRLFNQTTPAPFRVEVVFWGDLIAEVSADDRLVAKHWKGFASNQESLSTQFAIIRAEAVRMEEHATNLNNGIYNDFWDEYLPLKFLPTSMELATAQVLSRIGGEEYLVSSLNTLRTSTAAADREADRILDGDVLGLGRLHPLVRLVLNSAHHVVRGVDQFTRRQV